MPRYSEERKAVHCMQFFYNLNDPAMENTLYEIGFMRQFTGLKLDRLPDETTILKFRHFLEREGSIVDAGITDYFCPQL